MFQSVGVQGFQGVQRPGLDFKIRVLFFASTISTPLPLSHYQSFTEEVLQFEWERQKLLKRIGDIEGSDMWLEEFTYHVGKMAMLLGRRVVGMDRMAAALPIT